MTDDQTNGPTTRDAAPPPPPPPPAPPAVRKLRRSTDDKVIAGVCGGLGEYFAVDPVIFRIAFVVFAVAGGTGLFLYLASWLVLPAGDAGRSPAEAAVDRGTDARNVAAIVLLGVAALVLFSPGWRHGRPPGIPLLLIVVAGFLLWNRHRGGPRPSGAPPADPSAPSAAPASGEAQSPTADAGPVGAPPQDRSFTFPVLGGLLVAGGAVALLDVAGAIDVSPVGYLAAALAAVGAGLLVSARWGRARGLIPVGIVVAVALGVAAAADAADVPLRGGVGERTWRPTTPADVRAHYRVAMGELTLDLSRVDFAPGVTDVEASVGMGRLAVTVPLDVEVLVDGQAGMGEVTVGGERDGGVGADRDVRLRPIGAERATGTLALDLRVGMGEIEVRRAPA